MILTTAKKKKIRLTATNILVAIKKKHNLNVFDRH